MMDIRPNVLFNACVAGVAALLIGNTAYAGPNPPPYTIPTSKAEKEKITSAGYLAGNVDARSAMYAGAENINSLEACKNFGLAIVSNYYGPYPQGGVLMCFNSDKNVIAKFNCRGTETSMGKIASAAQCVPVKLD